MAECDCSFNESDHRVDSGSHLSLWFSTVKILDWLQSPDAAKAEITRVRLRGA